MNKRNELKSKIIKWIKSRTKNTIFVAIHGPQGSGKTTLTSELVKELELMGIKSISLSIDDFYKPYNEQVELAKTYPENPFLEYRGHAGTHDLVLLRQTLEDLKHNQGEYLIPRYDKTLNEGRGDRKKKEYWDKVLLPIDVIFFEGWFIGVPPVQEISDKNLSVINEQLKNYQFLWEYFDLFISMQIENFEWVKKWRVEAEERTREKTGKGLNEEKILDYVERFSSFYQNFFPAFYNKKDYPVEIWKVQLGQTREFLNFDI